MDIVTIDTPSLGDRTYVVTDGTVAAVIDPQRDIDRVLSVVEDRGVRVTDVFETHIHNDYVTGGLDLAHRCDATYHVNADDPVDFDRHGLRDGDVVEVGALTVRAIHTPGHTPNHLSYAVARDGTDVAVFTGGSMLFGSVGRTDLVAAERTEELTRAQFTSAHRLAADLPDDAAVLPTHGFGSFCSSGDVAGVDASTIGHEKDANQALTTTDEDTFVADLMAGLDAFPAYYAHMGPANLAGPDPADLDPPEPVDATELARRIHDGEWVVDLRTRTAYARDHLTGTVNVELATPASTYLGWILPWGTPLTLVADTPEAIAEMQRQLVRIGIDHLAGQHVDGVPDNGARASYGVTDFAGLRRAMDDGDTPWVLDSRRNLEWGDGHLDVAHHVPLHELEDRMDEVPTGEQVWIHCASGYRASIGASLLARAGREVVLLDDAFEQAGDHFNLV